MKLSWLTTVMLLILTQSVQAQSSPRPSSALLPLHASTLDAPVPEQYIEQLAQIYRTSVYHAYRMDRVQYNQRRAAWQQTLDAWVAAGRPEGQREAIKDWLRQATLAVQSTPYGPIPASPVFDMKVAETPPITKPPLTKPPVAQLPVTKPPIAKTPVAKTPVAKTPTSQPPITKPPVAKVPAIQVPVAKPPVAKTPVAKTPVTKPPVAQPPVAKAPTQPRVPMPSVKLPTIKLPTSKSSIRASKEKPRRRYRSAAKRPGLARKPTPTLRQAAKIATLPTLDDVKPTQPPSSKASLADRRGWHSPKRAAATHTKPPKTGSGLGKSSVGRSHAFSILPDVNQASDGSLGSPEDFDVKGPDAEVNLIELAARIAGNNMALSGIEDRLAESQKWDAKKLTAAIASLKKVCDRRNDLTLFRNLLPKSDRGLVGKLESPRAAISQCSELIADARAKAAKRFSRVRPKRREEELKKFDVLSGKLAKMMTGS